MEASAIRRTIDAVWRMESARIIARLTRIVRDVGLAEELAQDALVTALQQWPEVGVPDNPAAWLMTTAKRRAVDRVRRDQMAHRKYEQIGRQQQHRETEAASGIEAELDAALDDDVGDDLLRLMFMTCHPSLSTEARTALTLRLLGGLTTEEIARAFLAPEPTIAQRIGRAKKTLSSERASFEVTPRGDQLRDRLASVLEVIYLIFNEGYTATAGSDWFRPALCDEALRLGRILAELAPQESEVHGLVALMEIQASRAKARTGPGGEPILLLDQNRARWDRLLIRRGLTALVRAQRLGAAPGPYVLQAAIAACHAVALESDATNWSQIAHLYGELAAVAPSPIVELNRAVAVSMADGPQAALEIVDGLVDDGALAGYHLLPSVRGDLLAKLGRLDEAQSEFERAAALTRNDRERQLLLERARHCAGGEP